MLFVGFFFKGFFVQEGKLIDIVNISFSVSHTILKVGSGQLNNVCNFHTWSLEMLPPSYQIGVCYLKGKELEI